MASCPDAFQPIARLQTKDGICVYLGGISHGTYDSWQAKGIVPGPVPGTTRFDVRAHDAAIDRRCGLGAVQARAAGRSPLEEWESSHAA